MPKFSCRHNRQISSRMKRFIGAGLIALLCHGGLFFIKGKSSVEPAGLSLPAGICVTLATRPGENPVIPQNSQQTAPEKIAPRKQNKKPPAEEQKQNEQNEQNEQNFQPKKRVSQDETDGLPPKGSDTENPEPTSSLAPDEAGAAPSHSGTGTKKIYKPTVLLEKNRAPDYPQLARRRGLEGTVKLEVLVNPAGRVDSVRLAHSSGLRILDRAAVTAVKKWLFTPAREGNKNVAMWIRVPVSFTLHD